MFFKGLTVESEEDMKKVKRVVILLVLLAVIPTRGEIVSHQGHDIPASKDFQVWVNGSEMFTGAAGGKRWPYSFCAFDFSEPVTVKVGFNKSIKWVDILPSILKIEPKTIDDHTSSLKRSMIIHLNLPWTSRKRSRSL